MERVYVQWEDFVEGVEQKTIVPKVDLNKGHALMKTSFAPSHWRVTIKLLTILSILAIPGAVVLFFFVQWWIPTALIFTAFLTMNSIRKVSAEAVVETAKKDRMFYIHATNSQTMALFRNDD